MRTTCAFALVSFALHAGASVAQAGERTIRWSDLSRLVDEDPRLAEATAHVAEAQGALDSARAVPNPTLEVQAGRSVGLEGALRPDLGLQLTIPLGWLNDRGPRVTAGQSELRVAQLQAQAMRREVRRALRELFVRLAVAQTRVQQLQVLESQTAELQRLVSLRVEKGESRPVEVPRAEVELEKVRLELEVARAELCARRRQLALWVPALGDGRLRVEADLEALPEIPPLEESLAAVESGHPALEASRARLASRQAEFDAERRQRLPAFDLVAFAEQEPERRILGGGLAAQLPLWNFNGGGIRRAEAARAAEGLRLETGARQLGAEVVEAHEACALGRTAIARHRDALLPRAERIATTLERTFALGEIGLLDVIDAHRSLLQARREQLDAQLDAQLSCARLDALLGKETP